MPPYPNLIHPTISTIRPILRSATIQDDAYREPVQSVAYADDFNIRAQTELRKDARGGIGGISPAIQGYQGDEFGYLLFRRRELEATTITSDGLPLFGALDGGSMRLPLGSRVVAISGRPDAQITANTWIVRYQYMGHYPKLGWVFVRAYFADRKPGRVKQHG